VITSLQSPHVEAVKALLGSKGGKERREKRIFVVEGASNFREVFASHKDQIDTLYLTQEGREKIADLELSSLNVLDVTAQVMSAMSDTVTPQGILALVKMTERKIENWFADHRGQAIKVAYFWQLQDPGNAGTVIRAADAFGMDAILFSDNSVDIYSPKVVRSSVGSHWHIPIFEGVSWRTLAELARDSHSALFALDASGGEELISSVKSAGEKPSIWIFGNEARGLPAEITQDQSVTTVSIPMTGRAESLNLASAASVVMYAVGQSAK
jgi:TrmH family RNA methyltransferase